MCPHFKNLVQLAIPVNKSLLQACIGMTLQRLVHYMHQNRAQTNGDLNIQAVITNQIYSNMVFAKIYIIKYGSTYH